MYTHFEQYSLYDLINFKYKITSKKEHIAAYRTNKSIFNHKVIVICEIYAFCIRGVTYKYIFIIYNNRTRQKSKKHI